MSKKDSVESEKSDKSDKSDKSRKATFFQRMMAFLIDMLLVLMVSSFIAVPFVDDDSVTKLQSSFDEVSEKYMNLEIDTRTYLTESMPLTYQMAKKNGVISFITLFLEIMYFIVYQFNHNGQTIGKKLMKISVVSIDGEMSMNQMLFRTLIIDSILYEMILFGLMIFANMNVYFYGSLFFEIIQYGIIFASILMIVFSKSKRGLHDLISRTEVIKEN